MIESRYKIEYVLPDEKVKKSSPFRVLWYLLLIPLVLVAVTAITYDFSIKNITQDSSVLLEKAKVVILNLEDRTHFKKPEIVTNQLVEKVLIPKPKQVVKSNSKEIIKKPTIVKRPDNSKEKKLISELTAKQEQQLKEIQDQIEKNNKLAQSINSLSSKLVLEKTRNDSLNSRLSEQEKDKLELEEQLNNALAEFEKNKKTIKLAVGKKAKTGIELKTTKQQVAESKPKLEKTETVEAIKESKSEPKVLEIVKAVKIPEIKETPEPKKTETPVLAKSEEKKEVKELSATDKIVAAMSSANTEKSQEVAKQEESEIEPKPKNKEVEKAQETPKKEIDIVFALGVQNSENIKIDDSLTTSLFIETQEKEKTEDEKETENEVVFEKPTTQEKGKIAVKPDNKVESKDNPVIVEAPKTTSPVDEIIAAMQQTQANNATKSSQNIDPELEKDIKQQLVEQGDLTIDN